MMAKLVAVAYYLVERDHKEELLKLINFVCGCTSTKKNSIRQKQPLDKNGRNDDKSDENKSRADNRHHRGANWHRPNRGRCYTCGARGHVAAACTSDATTRRSRTTRPTARIKPCKDIKQDMEDPSDTTEVAREHDARCEHDASSRSASRTRCPPPTQTGVNDRALAIMEGRPEHGRPSSQTAWSNSTNSMRTTSRCPVLPPPPQHGHSGKAFFCSPA